MLTKVSIPASAILYLLFQLSVSKNSLLVNACYCLNVIKETNVADGLTIH